MNSPAYDVANILESTAFGLGVIGTDIFIGREPASPDNCITVFDTGGYEPESSDVVYELPTVMIKVRNKTYTNGYAKIAAIKAALHKAANIAEGTTRYIAIWAQSDIITLGYDDNNRALFSVNFRIHRTGV